MASAAAVMRKTVSVLFCDVAGSTELGEQLDPEALRTVMTRWFDEMRVPIERAGGTVEKFVGDAVMAVFGVPTVHEDDAFRAVQAAVEMRAAVIPLGLQVRIGVNTGEVVTGDGSTTLVTGDAVNTAKRLEEAATPGEILIGAATRRLVENATDLELVGPIAVKGKREPVEAWRVLRTMPDATPYARRLDAPLVGRTRELALLREELAAAERERALRLVTVYGAAGVGKSRLALEFLAGAQPAARVLRARCIPYGDGITFLPLRELLAEVDEELALEAATSEETFWAVRRLFEQLAAERPLLVCLEDVHWAEPTFLDLIEYLAGWTRDVPVLLLCLARPELLDARPRWGGASLTLEPLTEQESATLLDELVGGASTPARTRIAETAEGNPLFIEQMVAMLADDDQSVEVPPTIQALLAARLDRLDPSERAVVERAAVVGKEFWRSAVVELSPDDERATVAATLLSLARKELVRPERSAFLGDDGFRFRHALICDAAYSAIPKSTRAELHERFAGWLERRDAEDELVGYHLEQAARCRAELGAPDEALTERAGVLLAAAGSRAHARDDMPAARTLLERAVELAHLGPARPEALRELATARWATGDVAGAATTVDDAIRTAVELGDRRQEWYARLERAARQRQLHLGGDDLAAIATEAVEVFGALGDHAGLARAWRRLALVSYSTYHFAEAAHAAERALDHARRADDAAESARTVDVYCSSLLYGPEPAPSATLRCRELLADAASNRIVEAAVASALAGLTAMQGSFDEARANAGRAAAIYDDLGLRLLRAGLSEVIAAVDVLAGDLTAAERELRASRAVFEEAGAVPLAGLHAALLAQVVIEQGRLDEAETLLAISRAAVDETDLGSLVVVRLAGARLAAMRGRTDEALRLVEEAIDALRPTDAIVIQAEAHLIRASIAQEEPVEALELYELKGSTAGAARARVLVTEPLPR